MADNPINMFDPWGASEKSGGKSRGKDGGSSTSSSSGNSSSPSGGKSGGKSGGSSSGKSGGGISPKSINKDPDKFKEGERLFSGPFETDLMFHGGLFYHEQKYRSLVQDLVDSYGDGKAFDEKLSTFANENGFSENFIEIYAEQGRETYGGNEKIGDLGLKNPFINFGLESNDFDVIAIASVFGLAKNGIKYFLSRSAGRGAVKEGAKKVFRSFTASNYRYNLQVLTGKSGIGMDAHHIFPQAQKFQSYFQKVGINIHDPKNLVWWESGAHRRVAVAYNNAWSNFFRANPNATGQQIQNFGESLMKQYGF